MVDVQPVAIKSENMRARTKRTRPKPIGIRSDVTYCEGDENGSSWWHGEMLTVSIVVVVVILMSFYIGHHNGSNSWITLKTIVWTAAPVLVAYVVWTTLWKGSRSESCNESSESSAVSWENGQEPVAELEFSSIEGVDCGTQTDGRDFMVEAPRLKRCHQREMRRLTRQTRYFRRHMQEKLKTSSDHIKDKAKQLSLEHTELLPLVNRKKSLLDEQQTLQGLIIEEEARQREMAARFDRLTSRLH